MPTETTHIAALETAIDPQLLIATLRTLRARIPAYVQLSVAEARALRALANLDPALIEGVIVASSESQAMQKVIGVPPEVLREESLTIVLWDAVAEELRAMTQGVDAANLVRKHHLALTALQAYSIARQLVRNKKHADLIPHVERMRRLMKLGRRRASPALTTQEPTPTPAAEPTPDPG